MGTEITFHPVFTTIGYTLIVGLITAIATTVVQKKWGNNPDGEMNRPRDLVHDAMEAQKPGWQKAMIDEIVQRVKNEKCFAHDFINQRLLRGDEQFAALQKITQEGNVRVEAFIAVADERYANTHSYLDTICKELIELRKATK